MLNCVFYVVSVAGRFTRLRVEIVGHIARLTRFNLSTFSIVMFEATTDLSLYLDIHQLLHPKSIR